MGKIWNIESVIEFVNINSTSTLLSNDYLNMKSKLVFRCSCNEEFETTFSNFVDKGKRSCDKCKNHKKYTLDEVKEMFSKEGFIPLFKEYKNCGERLPIETKDGYRFLMSLYQFKQKKKIPIFHVSNPYTVENIKKYIENNKISCRLISEKYYSNNQHKLKFECSCGGIFFATWGDFRRKKRTCDVCGLRRRSGKNHYGYNFDITEKERIERRMLTPNENMRVFRLKVFERDSYTCRCCGIKSKKNQGVILNAHHLNGYHWNEEGRFDVDNGIALCENCHRTFHKIYGRKNNTEDQYNDFYRKRVLGLINT